MNEDEQNSEPTWGAAYGAGESQQPAQQSQVPPIGAGSSVPYPPQPSQPPSIWQQPAPQYPSAPQPPSAWQPAPLAPSAWQPAGQQPPRKRSVQPFLLIGLAVALVLGVVGAVVVIRQGADDPGQPVAGQLRGTFPSKPTQSWELDVADVSPGASFVAPNRTSQRYHGAGFIDLGDTLITSVMFTDSESAAELVAIDSSTGEVKWTADDVGYEPVCATETIDGLLPCIGRDASDYSAASTVRFYSVTDGAVDDEIRADEGVGEIAVHASAVYTFGYDADVQGSIVSRGNMGDLAADWQETYPWQSEDGCIGSGDSSMYGANDMAVYFGSDIGVTLANVDDGSPLVRGDVQGVDFYPGQGFIGRQCESTSDTILVRTLIFDEAGEELRSTEADMDSAIWPAENWLVTAAGEQPYVIGRTAYDFATGDELWTISGSPEIHSLSTVIGNTVLGRGHTDSDLDPLQPLSAFDLATGELLWSSDVQGTVKMSDGQRVVLWDDERLTALNLSSGDEEWSLALPDAFNFAPAGQGFAHAEQERITYYEPTGGPSVAPGRIAAEGESDSESGGLITRCGTPPQMRPVEYRTDDGGLLVRMEITATCPDGDIVSTDAMKVSISDDEGSIASGIFDFSADPLYLPGSGSSTTVEQELKFGLGSFWRLPNSLGESGSASSSNGSVAASADQLVDCTDEGTSTGPESVDDAPISTDVKTVTATGSAAVDNRDPEAVALDALRAQANADKPFILSDLADRWVPQVSSKQPGLVATDVDGITMVTWTAQEILNQHLRLRLKYPEVRLLWSDEWSSFNIRSWWVTVAGLTFNGPDAANAWCDSNSIPVNECFAKLVSNTRGPEGTTKYRW